MKDVIIVIGIIAIVTFLHYLLFTKVVANKIDKKDG